jgi:hypothetical protein
MGRVARLITGPMTLEDLEHRLANVETQHADYVRTLASHTAAMSAHSATLAAVVGQLTTLQQAVGTLVADVARSDTTRPNYGMTFPRCSAASAMGAIVGD